MTFQDTLLIIDDDERIRDLLEEFLSSHGFDAYTSVDGPEALDLLNSVRFNLIILDVMMPGMTGLDVAKHIRRKDVHTPILFLTALGATSDRINGFEMGGDDYLVKPFEPAELLLRIKAILKRTQRQTATDKKEVQIGPYFFNLDKATLRKNDIDIPLTTGEASLLKVFSKRIGTYLSREQLIDLIGTETNSRSIDVQITRLRRKIEDDPKNPRLLQTVRNKGYVLWDQ